nr:calcium homeostasis modulator protein 6-like [Pelodiscus sinensis]|eukprot:XP_025037551.1 calcium homeostasis modulator protein 6-like [Pelodiscus sinensis]
MDKRKKFFETWKDQFGIVSTSVCSLILIVLEKVMEVEFKCPAEQYWRIVYSVVYFVIPAVSLFFLSAAFLPGEDEDCECCCCCCGVLLKALVPSVIWVTLLLLDGRYVACAHEIPQNKDTLAAGADYPTWSYIISQIAGLALVAISALSFFLNKRCKSCCNN